MQHLEREHLEKDKKRDEELSRWGITVLRYSNEDVNRRFSIVANDILKKNRTRL